MFLKKESWKKKTAKQTFWDALYIRYGYILPRLPSKCVCGDNFTIVHALSCAKGGFISMRHNEIRDLTAELLHEVCYDVETEPKLNPVTGKNLFCRQLTRVMKRE